MHELSLVESLMEQTQAHAEGRQVVKITLTVGVLTCVDPSTMVFCFDACKKNAGMNHAQLIIERQYAQGECRQCGRLFRMESALQPCQCGSLDIHTQGGGDIMLKELEFA